MDEHSGAGSGGTLVSIEGANLLNATAVTFGDTKAMIKSDQVLFGDVDKIVVQSPGPLQCAGLISPRTARWYR